MRLRKVWNDRYRDVNFEINNYAIEGSDMYKDCWTFYLYLFVESFPEILRERIKPFVYFTSFGSNIEAPKEGNPLHDLEWHCGMTWISIETKRPPFVLIKAGCDYQHLWDDGKSYDENYVAEEAKKCIDSLYERFPEFIPHEKLFAEFRKKFLGASAKFSRYDENAQPLKDE